MMDRSRIGLIHADPSSATPAEIQSLAETAHEFHRTRGTKTLRDEFAMAALTGILANQDAYEVEGHKGFARSAYKMADAMMEARDE